MSHVITPALAGGSLIFLAVVILFLAAVVFGFYTYKGSQINPHPNDGRDAAPGSQAPSDATGKGRNPGDTSKSRAGDTFSSHGTG